jgi:hypothetical protein
MTIPTITLQRFTGLDRGMDLRLASNQYAVIAPLIAGAITTASRGSALEVIGTAGWTFTTWSLARELDPDQPLTATLASASVFALATSYPPARATAFAASAATSALMLFARATLNSTGKSLKPADEFTIAVTPLLTDLISGYPLRVLSFSGLSSLSSRHASVWSLVLAASSVVLTPFLTARLTALPVSAGLIALGHLNAKRPNPESRADNGANLETKRWQRAQAVVWTGAVLGALVTPWTLWAGAAAVGIAALTLGSRSKHSR